MTEPARPSTPTVRYGRYEVLFRIAAGGMAEVYVARIVGEGGFEKLVALKRMLPTLAEDERFVGMFLDEGRVAANISSPHVVQTLDLGRAEDDSLYLVMELVVGVSLAALTKVLAKEKTVLPLSIAVEILAQAAAGLEDAHEARTIYGEPLGIVHRDISPHNVLIDVSGRVRITDFGVARALERVTQTQSGEVKGKLAYFAPEQARAKPLDRRADVYALGIVGWETITGQRLFQGDGPADTLMKVLEMQAPRLESLRPDVPPALGDAIAHALERNLDLRTGSAGELAEALRTALPGAGAAKLGAFVRARGGEALLRLEDGIRALHPSSPSARLAAGSGSGRLSTSGRLSSPGQPPAPSPAPQAVAAAEPAALAEDATTLTPSQVSQVQARPAGSALPPAAVPVSRPPAPKRPVEISVAVPAMDEPELSATVAPLAAPSSPVAAPAQVFAVPPSAQVAASEPGRGPPVAAIGAAVAVLLALAGAAWAWMNTTGGAPIATPIAPRTPPAEAAPAAAELAAPAAAELVAPAVAEVAAPAPAVLTAPGTDPSLPEAGELTADEIDIRPGDDERSGRRPRAGRAPTGRSPGTAPSAPSTPSTTARPPAAAPSTPGSGTTPSSGTRRPEALRGMDDFESEIGGD